MNENKQKTAVEWLIERIESTSHDLHHLMKVRGEFEQAKQIEQKQHETTFHRGINIGALNPELDCEGRNQSAKHYYETTFKKPNF